MRYPQQLCNATPGVIPPGAVNEALGLLLGVKLGSGAYRDVYASAMNPDLVVKFEHSCSGRFCNVDEWNLWMAVAGDPDKARWFAPVRFISACGQFLVQERTQPLARMPKRIPNLVGDIKLENMGRLRGRPVFHDYANTKIDEFALKRFKLVDAS